MKEISQYEKQANDLLEKFNITFRVELIGRDCPLFCEDALADRDMDKLDTFPRSTHIHGKHYRCMFRRNDDSKPMSIDFWNSYADEEQNYTVHNRWIVPFTLRNKYKGLGLTHVSAYDVLACLTKYDPGSFRNFCSDFEYDTDSKRADATYYAVQEERRKVQNFFSLEEIEQLQEVQ
jgi:hypothetical protein